MWNEDLSCDVVLEKSERDLASLFDQLIDADALAQAMVSEEWDDRREVCQFLGVAPSTLSGWEKDNRIPLGAKQALGFREATRILCAEINRQKRFYAEPQVVRDGELWKVVLLKHEADGVVTGEVMGEANTEQAARMFAGSQRSLKLLEEAGTIISGALELTENHMYIKHLENIIGQIEDHKLMSCDIVRYRYDKSPQRAIDLLADLDKEL